MSRKLNLNLALSRVRLGGAGPRTGQPQHQHYLASDAATHWKPRAVIPFTRL